MVQIVQSGTRPSPQLSGASGYSEALEKTRRGRRGSRHSGLDPTHVEPFMASCVRTQLLELYMLQLVRRQAAVWVVHDLLDSFIECLR
jgi:hypothetical protein